MLQGILQGYYSDPPGWNWYVPKKDKNDNDIKDEDGLMIYWCLSGTNDVESMHQNLTQSFGHTISGPRYSDWILSLMWHDTLFWTEKALKYYVFMNFIEENQDFKFWNAELDVMFVPFSEKVICISHGLIESACDSCV